jgi:predicted nucleotidyltransferase
MLGAPSMPILVDMAAMTVDSLTAAALTDRERETILLFMSNLGDALGNDLLALWLYGSRARGKTHADSDIDLLVIADGGRDRYQRIAWDLSEDAAVASGESPFAYSVHVHDPEWLRGRREIESFFIREVDRDKLVLAGSSLD